MPIAYISNFRFPTAWTLMMGTKQVATTLVANNLTAIWWICSLQHFKSYTQEIKNHIWLAQWSICYTLQSHSTLAVNYIIMLFKVQSFSYNTMEIQMVWVTDLRTLRLNRIYMKYDCVCRQRQECPAISVTAAHATVTCLMLDDSTCDMAIQWGWIISSHLQTHLTIYILKTINCCGTARSSTKECLRILERHFNWNGVTHTRMRGDLTAIVWKDKCCVNILMNMHHPAADGNFYDEHENATVQDHNKQIHEIWESLLISKSEY